MLRFLLLLTLAGRVLAGDIAITVQSSVVPNGELPLTWSSDDPTYTVRILLNKSQIEEIKSLPKSSYIWTAHENVKVGDTLQFWVYDSAGNTGKTAFLPVIDKLPSNEGFDITYSSGVGSEASKTMSEAGSFGTKNGGNASSEGNETHTGLPSATSSRSSAILSASILPGGASDTLADTLASATSSATSSTSSSTPTSSSSNSSSSSSSSTSDDSDVDSSSSSNMTLYIGIGAFVLALIIGIAFFLWWRQHNKKGASDMQDPNEVEKQKGNYTAAQGKDDESYSEDDGTQKKEKGRSYSMGKGRRSSRRTRSNRSSSSSEISRSSSGSESSSSIDQKRRERR